MKSEYCRFCTRRRFQCSFPKRKKKKKTTAAETSSFSLNVIFGCLSESAFWLKAVRWAEWFWFLVILKTGSCTVHVWPYYLWPLLATCPVVSHELRSLVSVRTHDGHHCNYTEKRFHLLEKSFITGKHKHAFCYVACHSNDVLLTGFFGNLVLCNVLQQYVDYWFLSSLWWCWYTHPHNKEVSLNAFLNARVKMLLCVMLLSWNNQDDIFFLLHLRFKFSFLRFCVKATCK